MTEKCQSCDILDLPYRFTLCRECLGCENNKRCILCGRSGFLDTGFCQYHWYEEFKDDSFFTHQYKERLFRWEIMAHLFKNYSINVSYDTLVVGSGLRYRPDIHFVFSNSLFMIEIDENQHKGRQDLDEIRDKDIYDTLIGKYDNIFIIRINPDRYMKRQPMSIRKQEIVGPGELLTYMVPNEQEIEFRLNILKKSILEIFSGLIIKNAPTHNRLLLFFD